MKGNFQVRFLEGGGLATARLYSAQEQARSKSRHEKQTKQMKLQPSLLNAESSRFSPVFRDRYSTEAGAGRAASSGLKPSGQCSQTGSLIRRGARIG